jgi:hypothetical protein
MNELDEGTLRANLRRRAGGDPDPATLDRVSRLISVRVEQERERGGRMRRIVAAVPLRARVGLAAALVVALSFVAVPFEGGPHTSAPPPGSASAATPTTSAASEPSQPIPTSVQLLSLAELQRVVARGDEAAYAGRVVVADVDLEPPHQAIPACIPGCPGSVAGSNPGIGVYKPASDTDLLHSAIPDQGVAGPVIVRVTGVNRLELVGPLTVNADHGVVWSVPSFVRATDELPRTMDLRPNSFSVGLPFVVDGQLASGPGMFCTLETASPERIARFACGVTGWLAPAEVADPNAVIDSWSSRPADWVRVQNGPYQRSYRADSTPSPSGLDAVRGLYVVLPVVKYNATMCFQCDAGAVAWLYARLEAVAIP